MNSISSWLDVVVVVVVVATAENRVQQFSNSLSSSLTTIAEENTTNQSSKRRKIYFKDHFCLVDWRKAKITSRSGLNPKIDNDNEKKSAFILFRL